MRVTVVRLEKTKTDKPSHDPGSDRLAAGAKYNPAMTVP